MARRARIKMNAKAVSVPKAFVVTKLAEMARWTIVKFAALHQVQQRMELARHFQHLHFAELP